MTRRSFKRIQNFNSLYEHPWYAKQVRKLKLAEIEILIEWIKSQGEIDDNEFFIRVNRMYLEGYEYQIEKTKNESLIGEILQVVRKTEGKL